MDASTPVDNILQIRYPPTIEINVGKGPMPARVYWASPPVVFGINAFNSESDATVVMFSRQAIIIAPINTTPTSPAPCPRDTRQLVATIKPTEIDTTLASPSFLSLSPIAVSPFFSFDVFYFSLHTLYFPARLLILGCGIRARPHPRRRFSHELH